jgi:hypothetical protein
MSRVISNARPTVERLSADNLDIRELKRFGLLQDQRMILQGLRWPALSRIVSSRYWLELDFAGRDTMRRVRVSWTQCYLGGWRPWMHCPYCEKRVAKLLKGMGGYYCRACIGNPLYACQTKSSHGRRHLREGQFVSFLTHPGRLDRHHHRHVSPADPASLRSGSSGRTGECRRL